MTKTMLVTAWRAMLADLDEARRLLAVEESGRAIEAGRLLDGVRWVLHADRCKRHAVTYSPARMVCVECEQEALDWWLEESALDDRREKGVW